MNKTYLALTVLMFSFGNSLIGQTDNNKWTIKKVYKEQIDSVNRSKRFESVIINTSQETVYEKSDGGVNYTQSRKTYKKSEFRERDATIEQHTDTVTYKSNAKLKENKDIDTLLYDTLISMNLSARKAMFYNKWRIKNNSKAVLCMGVSYTPAVATRSVYVGIALPDDRGKRVNDRNDAEYPSYGWRYDFNIGLKFRLSHAFYVNPFIMRQGFRSIKKSIDWTSGITYDAPIDNDYAFDYYGVALGYRYNGHKRKINFIYDVSVYYMLLDRALNLHDNAPIDMNRKITGRNEDAFGIRSGIGFNYSPGYKWELFFLPNVSLNASSLNRNGAVKTYLRNTGISVGTSFLFLRTKKNN